MRIELAEALWTLGLLPQEEMSRVGLSVLEYHPDNEAAAILAGLGANESTDASRWFEKMLEALGREHMTREVALEQYVREVCQDIVARGCSAYEGSKSIWRVVLASGLSTHRYDPFIYAASEYEDRPSDRDFFASAIIKAAEQVLARARSSAREQP